MATNISKDSLVEEFSICEICVGLQSTSSLSRSCDIFSESRSERMRLPSNEKSIQFTSKYYT
jgi:hypothetical protein